MLDEKAIATLEGLLSQTLGDKRHLLGKLREAEAEVDNLRHEIEALENTARGIDSLLVTMRSGGRSIGRSLEIDDTQVVPSRRNERGEARSNIQDLPSRDLRRDNSIAYFNQNRGIPSRHAEFEAVSNRFNDRTITQSCTLLLREAGGPLHVNELYNLLVAGGMKFKGNNPTISVAVSLSRNSRFRKVDPGTFDLVIREAGSLQAAS
jgi:hypothetical protein